MNTTAKRNARFSIGRLNNSRSNSNGFTLLEVMLALVVMGVMLSLAVISLTPNPAQDLQRQGRRLQAVLQMAADETMMQGVEMALSLSYLEEDDLPDNLDTTEPGMGYQFLILNKDDLRWQPLDDTPFGFHGLGSEIAITVEIDGQQLDAQMARQLKRIQALQSEQQLQPALLLLSSGEMSPFTISLRHRDVEQAVGISSDGVSTIRLHTVQNETLL